MKFIPNLCWKLNLGLIVFCSHDLRPWLTNTTITLLHLYYDERTLDIGSNIPLCLQEFPWALLLGTPSSEGIYLTIYPLSCPNRDTDTRPLLTRLGPVELGINCIPISTRQRIYGQIYPFSGVYLTIYPKSTPNADSL